MDEISEPLSIPPWIWVALTLVISAALAMLFAKYRDSEGTRDPFSSRRRRHRHRGGHSSSRRHRRHRHSGD